jgi:hypothetical protein
MVHILKECVSAWQEMRMESDEELCPTKKFGLSSTVIESH